MFAAHGHEAATVQEEGLAGASDGKIYQVCQTEKRILVTLDLDFSDIRAYPPRESCGIIVLRLPRQDKERVLSVARQFLPLLAAEPITQRLWIVELERVRIRE
jgi:predicted nuclease of predicted toxin-antitoxin system